MAEMDDDELLDGVVDAVDHPVQQLGASQHRHDQHRDHRDASRSARNGRHLVW